MATVGRAGPRRLGDEISDPVPHLSGGFIGEGDGQNRPARDLMGGHQVGHAVGDDPGFAASGPGQDQQRAFDVWPPPVGAD